VSWSGRIGRRGLGQRLAQDAQQLRNVPPRLRAHRDDGLEIPGFGEAIEERDQLCRIFQFIDFVNDSDDALLRRDFLQNGAVLRPEAQRLDHEEREVGIARRLGGAAVEPAMQRAPRLRLLPGRIDEDVLAVRLREDPGDEVARGLRLGRDDGNLLADQAVEQARLAGVGTPGDADRAAAMRSH
jgi:hypothetical protein